MSPSLFVAFATLCTVVGVILAIDRTNVLVVALYSFAAILFVQIGYVVTLLLRGA